MAYQLINVGAAPNDKSGDPLRTAFKKINALIQDHNDGTGTYRVVDANVKAEIGQVLFVDATAQDVVIALPDSPVLGSTVEIVKVAGTNDVTFNSVSVTSKAKFTYVSSTFGWVQR
ncbi:putative baseplate structural protein [Rhizobium phage RHph_Y68]|uniref:Putative baseplate structural protein n=1 Tax=Rhizobium phage RHph_Y68 TaxID=2509787 RepID=A0A7S5US78_9CAUD|nr:putative baseplate structural protein [Rhizobium phage RHph_Y68]QIG67953.1 putative baseplate structural protein [Rhizobium phage RHph_Y68]